MGKNELRMKQKLDFVNSLPESELLFTSLFNYLDKSLESRNCDGTIGMTLMFLEEQKANSVDEVIEWLNNNGGYCDCEILSNVEEKFE